MSLTDRSEARRFLTQFDGFAPNEDQLDVIMAPARPAVVVAGAGAGKTKTMALRVIYQVAIGAVSPDDVLGLTFTKKAANELATRVAAMMRKIEDLPPLTRPTITTYNSFAASIASDYGLLVGIDPSSRLINEAERYQIMSDIVRTWPGKIRGDFAPSTIADQALALAATIGDNQITTDTVRQAIREFSDHVVPLKVAQSTSPGKYIARLDYRLDLLDIVDAFFQYKKLNRLTEFSDQVSTAAAVLASRPAIADAIRQRHKLVLLDEYQDTSSNQASFLATLFAGSNVVAVGDPHQAIYGWRGASAAALDDFVRTFGVGEPVDQYSLMTAYRNKAEILSIANSMTEPLRRAGGRVKVSPLHAGAGDGGQVDYVLTALRDESYEAIADDIETFMAARRTDNNGRGPSMAVLCRARSSFEPMARALDARGIAYIEHGNYNAYSTPECLTVRSLLRAASHPGRGEALMRVLETLRIGAADLAGLGTIARTKSISFIEALEFIDEAGLTDLGRSRLQAVASWIDQLSSARYQRPDDQVGLAIRLLGLDTEVGARSRRGGVARSALAALQSLASGFADQVEGGGLTDFLDLLENIDAREKGGTEEGALADLGVALTDVTEAELEEPSRVTIMTMHAAKGLEWDYVAIPEVCRGKFDLLTRNPSDYWLAQAGSLPSWIRADAADIPHWDWMDPQNKKELTESFNDWLIGPMTDHANNEIRRLAYVAATRPRDRLFLSGYWFTDAAAALKARDKGIEPEFPGSRLFAHLEAHGVLEPPEIDDVEESSDGCGWWPLAGATATEEERAGAERITAHMSEPVSSIPASLQDLADDLRALQAPSVEPTRLERLTAGGVVAMSEDPETFRADVLRPIPREPGLAARRGSQIHEYIAGFFGVSRAADLLEVGGAEDQVLGLDTSDPGVMKLIDAFTSSEFALQAPLAIEAPVDVMMAGLPLRGTIDAVFSDGNGIRIVDWKTGRRPSPEVLVSRQLQLQLYRLAWSMTSGTALEDVGASFVYLGEDDVHQRRVDVEKWDEDRIRSTVTDLVERLDLDRPDRRASADPSGTPGR